MIITKDQLEIILKYESLKLSKDFGKLCGICKNALRDEGIYCVRCRKNYPYFSVTDEVFIEINYLLEGAKSDNINEQNS